MAVTIKTRWHVKNETYTKWRLTQLTVTGKFFDSVSLRLSDTVDGAGTAVLVKSGLAGEKEEYVFNLSKDSVFKAKVRVDITGTGSNIPEIQTCFIAMIPEARYDDYANFPDKVKPLVLDLLDTRGLTLIDIPFDRGHMEGEDAASYDLHRGYVSAINMISYDYSYGRMIYRAVYDPQNKTPVISGTLALNGIHIDNSGLS